MEKLRVGEFLAFSIDEGGISCSMLVDGPKTPMVLCRILITVVNIDNTAVVLPKNAKIGQLVQFSHFSVKKFPKSRSTRIAQRFGQVSWH